MQIDFKDKLHQRYIEYTELYDNYENTWLDLRKLVGNKFDESYISLPLPRTIVQTYSNLAFGNHISVSIKSNLEAHEAINDWIEDNDFNMILSESSISQAIKGGIVFLNYLDNGMSRIKYIEPEYYFPEVSPIDRRKVLSEVIAIPYVENDKKYLHTETYQKGENGNYLVTTQVFSYANDKQGKALSEPEIVDTGLTISPITYIPFSRSGNSFYGDSIFAGLLSLFDVLNYRVSQINEILALHADPSIVADSTLFDDDGNLNIKGSKVFENNVDGEGKSGNQPLYYLTWNGQLGSNFKLINEILLEIMKYASPFLNPALNGMDKTSQASGRAIKLKSHNTQAMVERSYQYWRRGIKKILLTAQQLQVLSGEKTYTPTPVKVELSQMLPDDDLEMAQAEQLKVQSGLSSKKSAIARLNKSLSSQQVEEEFLEILEEQNQNNQQTFMSDMLGFGRNNTQQGNNLDES
ncbi:phage portal protein [Oceanobacillus caeni]|uniref:phage portal protein n=1 Tax=Oceanobacillus caeni TaxID=405946 RepID=UPI002149CCA3|nr:phage portal protein [Oceanobacillus caeni]MCR1833142.1 phage portal protein [Oceanobacillus caeni]